MEAPDVVIDFVRAASDADQESAAACVTKDALLEFPGGRVLRAFPSPAEAEQALTEE